MLALRERCPKKEKERERERENKSNRRSNSRADKKVNSRRFPVEDFGVKAQESSSYLAWTSWQSKAPKKHRRRPRCAACDRYVASRWTLAQCQTIKGTNAPSPPECLVLDAVASARRITPPTQNLPIQKMYESSAGLLRLLPTHRQRRQMLPDGRNMICLQQVEQRNWV